MKHSVIPRIGALLFFLWGNSLPAVAQENTWESPPVDVQLEMDDIIVPIGKGAIFVPAMTDVDNEPVYGVLSNGRMVSDSKTGHRIPLAPGEYTVLYGSGMKDQMMQKKVRVEEGSTTLVKPDWAGLVIDVINESRQHIREYYELFNLDNNTSYGIGQGIEEGLDDKLRTWILPPGTYKIVKPGDNVNAVINFGTIRLLPGELVRASLVIDSSTDQFLGFGVLGSIRQGAGRLNRRWNARSEIAGNALLNYTPSNTSALESNTNMTATAQWLTDARYESGHNIIPIWANLEEGISLQGRHDIRKYTDRAELRLTYIFRLNDYLNPYARFGVESSFFRTYHRFDDPTTYSVLDSKGNTVRTVENAKLIKLADPLSPILLKQGFGATATLLRTIPANLTLRSGFGARQTLARNAYVYNTDTKVLVPVAKTNLTGVEALLLGDFRLGRYILLTTQFDILMPRSRTSTWIYDGENRLRLNLTGNVSLLLTHEYWRDETLKKNQSRYQTLLRFSKYL